MLNSTSTAILLLTQRIDNLEHYFDWTVGATTFVLTVLIALFVAIQGFYARKIQREELEKIELSLSAKLIEAVDKKALDLQSFVETEVQGLRIEIQRQKRELNGDIARSYALVCEEKNFYARSFTWWLSAACDFNAIGSNLLTLAIKSAKENIEKIKEGDTTQINALWEDMVANQDRIDELKTGHKTEAEILEILMKEKASLKGEISTAPVKNSV